MLSCLIRGSVYLSHRYRSVAREEPTVEDGVDREKIGADGNNYHAEREGEKFDNDGSKGL